ncbi:MAG: tRNA pseudouridine(55) synthase TruB [Deltaproteobacteria bacterium]|nr:MAG: tRNA pseudouridine(55) synthase TruB [Deltaproteobacteria bacterium]
MTGRLSTSRQSDGILLVDKPDGLTSAAVVARVKRTLRQKVGHLGTLDPFATGLLPICVGEGTKLAQFLAGDSKRYVGEIVLGATTDTLDRTGAIVERRAVPSIAPATLAAAVAPLRGAIMQTPPMYSALKREGVPLYRLARAGHDVERAARPVHVAAFDVAFLAPDRLAFAVECSKGTYVRVLAHDLGAALGTGAHLATLRRTAFGPFSLADAVPLHDVEERATRGTLPLLTPSAAMTGFRAIVADAPLIAAIRDGRQQALRALGAPHAADEVVRIESADGVLIAVAAAVDDGWRLARVMAR